MSLPAHELDAFRMVARTQSFSAAASVLHVTQPALSQRIQSLERALGLTLFVRDRKGLRMTDAGLKLLRYCEVKDRLEAEVLAELKGPTTGPLGGAVRLAGYSSVLRSVLLPALAGLFRAHPEVRFELGRRETRELPGALERGEVDYIVLDRELERASLETHLLGHEKYVAIATKSAPEVYLDHDPEDRVTEHYLRLQGDRRSRLRRAFVADVDGILAGVALGLGRGVVPRHLVPRKAPFEVEAPRRAVELPVVLHHFRQPHYTRLHEAVVATLTRECPKLLDAGII